MKKRVSKTVATVLALSILVLPGTLSARERRGTNIVITLKDGQTVAGELISVKPDSLLLFTGRDESVDLVGIKSVKIVRKSKALFGTVCGFLAGALLTALVVNNANEGDLGAQEAGAIVYGAIGGVAGGLVGYGFGAAAGKDKVVQLEGMSESDQARFLERLRRKARIRD